MQDESILNTDTATNSRKLEAKLRRGIQNSLRRAADIQRKGEDSRGVMPPEKYSDFRANLKRASEDADILKAVRDASEEAEGRTHVRIRSEERTYRPDGEHSYFQDLALRASGAPGHLDSGVRLLRHAHEVSVEMKAGTAEGRTAARKAETRQRGDTSAALAREVRAMSTGTGSGGALVTPLYLNEDADVFRYAPPSFLKAATRLQDPGFGMQLNVPVLNSASGVAQQTENTGESETDPGSAFVTTPLVTMAGQVTVSLQLQDRAPASFDKTVTRQLTEQLYAQADAYTIAQAVATAGTVTNAAAFTNAILWGDTSKASSQMYSTAGTVLLPTHLFTTPTYYEWMSAQVDGSARPIVTPVPSMASLPFDTSDDSAVVGFTGERILTTAVFTDANIPAIGSNTQLIVAHAPEVFVLLSEPAIDVIPETFAQNLSVIIRLYSYLGALVRHPLAVQQITGATYVANPSFA